MAKPSSFSVISWLSVFCILISMTYSSQASTLPTNPTPSKKVLNKIDACWRLNPNWAKNRQALADCAVGFGSGALGGKGGAIYVVTDPSDDPVNPKQGTLRYGVIQPKALWIIFQRDMSITLAKELMVGSFKTIDGRGARVNISNGPCITLENAKHVIIHGILLHDCKPGPPGMIRSSGNQVVERNGTDGDGITIYSSTDLWIDHCYIVRCTDGLLDITHASTAITISNTYFSLHDKVMLLGHSDAYTADRVMKVTVVFNHFGLGLVERMPRIRFGYVHVANNMYEQWSMYAVGGSAAPTILSEGNYFIAPNTSNKEVTKRETNQNWKGWNWKSVNDIFMNGAFFVVSGTGSCAPNYTAAQAFAAARGSSVPALTLDAGFLICSPNRPCS